MGTSKSGSAYSIPMKKGIDLATPNRAAKGSGKPLGRDGKRISLSGPKKK